MDFFDKLFSLGKKKVSTLESDINSKYIIQNAELELKNARIFVAQKIEELIHIKSSKRILQSKVDKIDEKILMLEKKVVKSMESGSEEESQSFAINIIKQKKRKTKLLTDLDVKKRLIKFNSNLIEKAKFELEESEYKLKEWRTKKRSAMPVGQLEAFNQLLPSDGYFSRLSQGDDELDRLETLQTIHQDSLDFDDDEIDDLISQIMSNKD